MFFPPKDRELEQTEKNPKLPNYCYQDYFKKICLTVFSKLPIKTN